VGERWFYLEPFAVFSASFPKYEDRKSTGVSSVITVDPEYPYTIIPVPL